MRSRSPGICLFLPGLVVMMAALLLVGCGREGEPSSEGLSGEPAESTGRGPASGGGHATDQAPDAPVPEEGAAVADEGAVAVEPQALPLEGMVHGFMTRQLHRFIREHNRMPTDFGEFVNARMDSVPFPPPGMEYAIDYQSRQVKVVRSAR